ncbi:hypothetical protein HYX12_01145 [Candidatus Woesearchaeota archaeon]|nr:hypothetical protein [Candidatus Woesearchaeota archaeon]
MEPTTLVDTTAPVDKPTVLAYISKHWDEIERIAQERGIDSGFYPITLPETDDLRFTDQSLPSINTRLLGLWKAHISNPPDRNFQGIRILEEDMAVVEEGVALVQVAYIQQNGIYRVQCLREKKDGLSRYLTVSVPEQFSPAPEVLQKAYNNLEQLLGNEQ